MVFFCFLSSIFFFVNPIGTIEQILTSCDLPPSGSPYFPKNFSFGVATSAYQIEGGWNADGKGPSSWDDFTQNYPHLISDGSTANIAADSYHRFDQDLSALKDLKVNHYRFSISWSRIFPNGDISSRNQKGIDYYNKVIDKLLENGIEPMVTMFHFDLPLDIQKIGGLTNDLFVQMFVTYATELFENFGDRVKLWLTFNEPHYFCKSSYADGFHPPQVDLKGEGDYMCMNNTIKAHAEAYKVYKSRFYEKQRGKIGLALGSYFYFSKSSETEAAAHRALQFSLGFLAQPIFSKSGGYPEEMTKGIELNSLKEGRHRSRLPNLSGYWKNLTQGSADFFALNYYTSRLIKRSRNPSGFSPSWEHDMDCDESLDPTWLKGKTSWLYCVPEGLESLLKYIRDEYENIEVIITENGWADEGEFEDDSRIQYLKSHLQAVLNAINDGCNVTGYTYWSLMDNFEWESGFTAKFGLYAVNMLSPKRERTPKKSADYYKKVIKYKKLLNEINMYTLLKNHKINKKSKNS
ncbi:myrosinase 1-like [Eupeodes corollae]|uniref:myrosinase 1-like n=1 Tax=Eupeodes corollae TaxID=290404 RepID=UPI00249089DA|nr:myrosinase 1-like [Eupeodes corollae]